MEERAGADNVVMEEPMRVLSALFVLVALLAGCNQNQNPSGPDTQACRTNNTADVTFENRSATSKTYTIVWDGSSIATVAPGQKSQGFAVAAGVQHTLQFRVANTNTVACSTSTPTPAQCFTHNFSCTY